MKTIALLTTAVTGGLISGTMIRSHTLPLSALTPAAVHALQGQQGPQGAIGATGPVGPQGAAGGFNPAKVVRIVGQPITVQPQQSAIVQADCPTGSAVVGGGGSAPQTLASFPTSPGGTNPPTSWAIDGYNPLSVAEQIQAYAVCAS